MTEDLHWHDGQTTPPNLFVTGAMTGLQVGLDAGNLMRIRKAALVVANSLECQCWLREKEWSIHLKLWVSLIVTSNPKAKIIKTVPLVAKKTWLVAKKTWLVAKKTWKAMTSCVVG